MTNAVTFSMNKNLSTEVVEAIADALHERAGSPSETTSAASSASLEPAKTSRPVAGVLRFVADLLSNSAVSGLFGAGRPEAALLRGSLVGLASGVEAVTKDGGSSDSVNPSERRFSGIVTVSAYVLGGIAVALIVRALRRESQNTTVPFETGPTPSARYRAT